MVTIKKQLLWVLKNKIKSKREKPTIKLNKTARIRAKPWMLWLPSKVYGAVITRKNQK